MIFEGIARRYNDLKIGQKLILIFLVISVIPITLLQIYNFARTQNNMTKQIDEIIYNDLIGISERTNLSMETYTNLLYQIYVDDDIISQIEILFNGTETRKASARSAIRGKLKQYTSTIEDVRCISLVCSNGESVIYDFNTDSAVHNLWDKFSDMRITPPVQGAKNSPGMVITPSMKFSENGKTTYYFHISKRMFDFDHLDKGSIATVIMSVDEKALKRICNNESVKSTGINFILDDESRVVSYPDSVYVASIVSDMDAFIRQSGFLSDSGNIATIVYEDKSTSWKFVSAYDVDEVLQDLRASQRIMIFISLIILITVVIIINYTIRNLNRSVRSIVNGMQKVQNGNLKERISVHSEDEFGVISNNFNLMTERVENLLSEVSEAKDRQKDAEIKALEAQINPHFLYNTLDSINWMAIEKGENEISKALSNLGLILRHSVSRVDAKTTVGVEKDFLNRYLELQSIRFENAFLFNVVVSQETEKMQLHKLLIQPFVENAIIHGFEGIEEGGEITVHIDMSEKGDYLQISIGDNGKGMPADLLEKMNNREYVLSKENDSKEGLGLRNAFSRLVMYYGDRAHWTINSVKDIGTEITLYIPADSCIV
ncbi:cache domain-containing sensor histidine kinase [Butyrivibrio sp. AC2005]|uniref:cache domain-containing sensor histidine kinase n=1 Tax=Butyrivibrio sp. AC2005 TaxID=1280672 RepID=UPI0003F860A1|nr:histidine kinase [Butyrivibrio sp. AC2005]